VHGGRRSGRVGVLVVVSLVVGLVGLGWLSPAGAGSAGDAGSGLVVSADELAGLPASGPAWASLRAVADQPIVSNLADQDSRADVVALAAGLVFARTGDAAYRVKVIEALKAVPGTEVGGRTLSLGRQLAGWVMAADLVGYRDPAFMSWLAAVRTSDIGNHGRWVTLTQTHEETSSNWGTFAGASRLAASLYLGDAADVARVAVVFKGWLGDRGAYAGFVPTADFDPSWACGHPQWVPVNPAGCGDRDGALVEDISRGDPYPNPTSTGLSYSWEALQGAVLQAVLLARHGYPDVWQWQDQALRRATAFMAAHGGFLDTNFHPINHWVPWVIDQAYGTRWATNPAGAGRQFGFTDWLTTTGAGTGTPETVTSTTSSTATSTTTAVVSTAPRAAKQKPPRGKKP